MTEDGELNPAILDKPSESDEMPAEMKAVAKRMQYMGICMRRRLNTFIPYPCLRSAGKSNCNSIVYSLSVLCTRPVSLCTFEMPAKIIAKRMQYMGICNRYEDVTHLFSTHVSDRQVVSIQLLVQFSPYPYFLHDPHPNTVQIL